MSDRIFRLLASAALIAVSVATVPAAVSAQTTVTEVVGFLMTNQQVPTGDIARDQQAAEVSRDTVTGALIVNLTSVPLATSSSGFLYRLNPQLGTVERATGSFGAFFVERALTAGHGRASFGISATSAAFDQLDGNNLRDGTLLTIANRFSDESAPFDTETLTLRIRSSTMTAFANVGITDRFEIGGALPFVRLTLEGQRVTVYRGTTFLQASGAATANGVGDAAIRAKYTLAAASHGGAAVAAEVRLPTGDADNLLGAGTSSFRILGIGAVESGPAMFSGNAGIVRGGISDEFTFGGATAIAVHPRLSLTGEMLGRHVSELRPIELASRPHPTIAGVNTIRLIGGEPGRLLATGIAGVKWNPAGTLVIGAHVRWNFTNAGLTAPLTPAVGFEYAF